MHGILQEELCVYCAQLNMIGEMMEMIRGTLIFQHRTKSKGLNMQRTKKLSHLASHMLSVQNALILKL